MLNPNIEEQTEQNILFIYNTVENYFFLRTVTKRI